MFRTKARFRIVCPFAPRFSVLWSRQSVSAVTNLSRTLQRSATTRHQTCLNVLRRLPHRSSDWRNDLGGFLITAWPGIGLLPIPHGVTVLVRVASTEGSFLLATTGMGRRTRTGRWIGGGVCSIGRTGVPPVLEGLIILCHAVECHCAPVWCRLQLGEIEPRIVFVRANPPGIG
jgi:hypothetical protein